MGKAKDKMDIKNKENQLVKRKISIDDLTDDEVNQIKKSISKQLLQKRNELKILNQKIKDMKKMIDSLSN